MKLPISLEFNSIFNSFNIQWWDLKFGTIIHLIWDWIFLGNCILSDLLLGFQAFIIRFFSLAKKPGLYKKSVGNVLVLRYTNNENNRFNNMFQSIITWSTTVWWARLRKILYMHKRLHLDISRTSHKLYNDSHLL